MAIVPTTLLRMVTASNVQASVSMAPKPLAFLTYPMGLSLCCVLGAQLLGSWTCCYFWMPLLIMDFISSQEPSSRPTSPAQLFVVLDVTFYQLLVFRAIPIWDSHSFVYVLLPHGVICNSQIAYLTIRTAGIYWWPAVCQFLLSSFACISSLHMHDQLIKWESLSLSCWHEYWGTAKWGNLPLSL